MQKRKDDELMDGIVFGQVTVLKTTSPNPGLKDFWPVCLSKIFRKSHIPRVGSSVSYPFGDGEICAKVIGIATRGGRLVLCLENVYFDPEFMARNRERFTEQGWKLIPLPIG